MSKGAINSPAPSVGEPVAQWQTSASGEGGWMNIDADEVEFCRDKRGYKVRALVLATPPAAPAATEAPSKPFAYYIHIAAEQRGEFVHDLDEALDDLTNCECKITELFDHATPAPGAPGQESAAVQAMAQETDRDWSKAQDWKGMDGATAFLLINRHSDGWGDVGAMMNAWLAANAAPSGAGEKPS